MTDNGGDAAPSLKHLTRPSQSCSSDPLPALTPKIRIFPMQAPTHTSRTPIHTESGTYLPIWESINQQPYFITFCHATPSTMAGYLFIGMFFTLYYHLNVQYSLALHLFVAICYIPDSSLHTILLVVLEYSSIFSAAATHPISSCFGNFAFPSQTFHAYSIFGTITFIRVYIFKSDYRGASLLGSRVCLA